LSAAAHTVSLARLKRRALSLGAVKSFDHAMRFLLPVVLARCLDTASFGEYRLLWLVVGTVSIIATLNMGATLYFFVPRSEPGRKRLYVHHTMLFLAVSGLLWGFLVSPWNPALPAAMEPLTPYGLLVPAFVALWIFTIVMDNLPSVDERIRWQAYVTLGVSALRVVLVGLGAWLTGGFLAILWLLMAVVLFKVGLMLYYVRRHHGLQPPWFERAAFSEQFRHSAPIGVNNALNGFKGQADQWVAASLFAISSFAAFSIAALIGQMMTVLRLSVLQAFLPSMSRLQAAGDVRGMLDMNSRGNVMVGRLLYPVLAFTFVFAEEMVTLLYTAAYAEAAPAMRMYIIGMLPMAIEMGSLVLLLRRGSYALLVTVVTLALSVAVSWTAATHIGLAGAAAGSVLAVYLDRAIMLRHIAQHTGIPLRRLQNWHQLALSLALAAATAALAWVLVEHVFPQRGPVLRLCVGAALFALVYAPTFLRKGWALSRKHKEAA
jgi:O-antigen/teichoic acid export membrane protein